jgi:hypothetical protein
MVKYQKFKFHSKANASVVPQLGKKENSKDEILSDEV